MPKNMKEVITVIQVRAPTIVIQNAIRVLEDKSKVDRLIEISFLVM